MMNIVYWCWEGENVTVPHILNGTKSVEGGKKTYISPKYDNNNHNKANPGGGGVVGGGSNGPENGDSVDTCGGCPIAVGDVVVFRSCP